jgi:hypothetical protein
MDWHFRGWGWGGKNTKPVKEFPQRAPQGCNPVWLKVKARSRDIKSRGEASDSGPSVGTVATAWETVVVVKLERANTWKASGTAHQTEKKWTLFFFQGILHSIFQKGKLAP